MRQSVFDAAVATHGTRVWTLAVYLLGNATEAEDVVQEVLIRLWRHGARVQRDRLRSWLMRVTRNACIDAVRCRRRGVDGQRAGDIASLGHIEIDLPGPERLAQSAQLGDRIAAALARLREPQRSVVVMREIQGMSYREIAEVMEMPLNSVRVALHRARARLRLELEEVRDHVATA
ncbi:MAG: RNA polymerase sigma factor [Holophagae bacterium]|jgi:RNA polymerase sigma-70 factor (ECF subfamily)